MEKPPSSPTQTSSDANLSPANMQQMQMPQPPVEQVISLDGSSSPVSTRLVSHMTFQSGPLPSPETFAKYAQVDPELPKAILARAEAEQKHRHEIKRSLLDAEIADARAYREQVARGQWLAAGLLLVLAVGAIILAINNQPITAGILGGSMLVSIIGIIVTGERAKASQEDSRSSDTKRE